MKEVEKHTISWQLPVYTLLILLIVPASLQVLGRWWTVDFDWLLAAIIPWAVFSIAYCCLLGWKAYLGYRESSQEKEYEHLIRNSEKFRE